MNKTRILSGFSMVEMMLLLLVTSLMLASAVTIVTKKHVKVPKITMHGAYMCYMKNGRLHEEQYVGSGTNKKILDRDVAQCSFTPPERASYLYVQAIGGGGGGGDSGYSGGNLQVFESATEVISPFGITENLLTLKGISKQELETLGGDLYAYAMAEGAGKGGDLYYIKEECGSGCLVSRTWKYEGSSERKCKCTSEDVSYKQEDCKYDYPDTRDCTGYYCDHCSSYSKTDCTGKSCDGCYSYDKEPCTGKGCESCYSSEWVPRSCDKDGKNCVPGYYSCTNGYNTTDNCNDGYDYTEDCLKGYDDITSTGNCTNYYNVPHSATCSKADYKDLTVSTTDKYAQDTTKNPPYRIKTIDSLFTAANAMAERKVSRDEQDIKDICNYGNPAKFTGVSDGIFGTFFIGEDEVPVECTTDGIRNAFGEDIFPMGVGVAKTTSSKIVNDILSSAIYGSKIEYDRSESDTLAYGESCTNVVGGSCTGKTIEDSSFKNPVSGIVYNTKQSLATDCSYNTTDHKYWTDDNLGCNGSEYDCVEQPNPSSTVDVSCSCEQDNSSDGVADCLYSYGTPGDEGVVCQYIPVKAVGGAPGTGTQCRTNKMPAGLGLNYVGNSSVVAGIRGSDLNGTAAKNKPPEYKPLYSQTEWQNQPSSYAQNGTDAQGSSIVTMTGPSPRGTNSCTANYIAPTKGQGAKKISTGTSAGTDGAASTRNGTTSLTNATNGEGCGDQHVGYCLVHKKNGATAENGKYTYRYTWNTNYLQFGEGGKAGEYRAMVLRSFANRQFPITLGQGGAGGAEATGDAGAEGLPTIVGDVINAAGGAGGPGGQLTPTEQLPTWYSGGDFVKGWNGTQGESANVSNFKSNILNLVLPVDNTILGQWLAASGAGGDGGGSRNDCWASEWYREFEEFEVIGNQRIHEEDITCRPHPPGASYWSATPTATSGLPGAVLIRW